VISRTETPPAADLRATTHLSTPQANALRSLLVAGLHEASLRLSRHRAILAALVADSAANTTGCDRAMAALRMYRAREAVEEFEGALVRMGDGSYGNCDSCHRPMPLERLELIPQARSCAFCAARLASSADPGGPPPGQRPGEGTDALASLSSVVGAASPRDCPYRLE
jgi:DnaK suppressor protein